MELGVSRELDPEVSLFVSGWGGVTDNFVDCSSSGR